MLTKEMSHGITSWRSGSKERLQQMFPSSASEEEEDELKSFTENYHKYKREFVKLIGFNPEEEHLSKWISN